MSACLVSVAAFLAGAGAGGPLDRDLREREITRELYMSQNTVHSHVRSIYRKLAVSTRADALERTRKPGLL